MFIGEAPGRLGADGSHLPFHGDVSGHNFEKLIEQVGISRYQAFVTNAVLCNPRDERGNNATPTAEEVANCSPFLRETVEIVDPAVVVTLGAVALKGCGLLNKHAIGLREHVRSAKPWMGRTLIPVYHPGQRAMVHRSFANQLSDYQFIAEFLRRSGKPRRKPAAGRPRSDAMKLGLVATKIIQGTPRGLSYFALHKLCFLAEIASLEATGERMTNAYVVRQKDGPYFVDLHIARLGQLVPEIQVRTQRGQIRLDLPRQRDLLPTGREGAGLSAREESVVERVLQKYGEMSDANLKRVVYLSQPMRALLRKERTSGVNLYNAVVLPFDAGNA